MVQNLARSNSISDAAVVQSQTSKQRLDCSICNYHLDLSDASQLFKFSCNVRAFRDASFNVWRCPQCQTIHCLEVVDLDHYYSKYPIAAAVAHNSAKACFRNIYRRLKKHGFSKSHTLLDYGCGGNGLFVQYLRGLGYTQSYGYDPYSQNPTFSSPDILRNTPFDYVFSQDVIEHVEEPDQFLNQLDQLVASGGYIFVGTPNADNIDLSKPEVAEYYNEVHVPYHLHMYNRATLERLGAELNWQPVEFFERPFHDLLIGMNSRAWNQYIRLFDGSLDVIYEPSQVWKAISSPKFWFYALFGYWLSFQTNMAMVFQKK